MICLSVAHQSREESVSDLSFSESLQKMPFRVSKNRYCLVSMFCFNLDQCAVKLIRLACLC